ncbi:MAG: hypothetical protein GY947_04345 [Rhodobacteraceae bacterium]|nr:hypothetical protein [Paracoccaceae bacterium]
MMMEMEFEPLTGTFGAIVHGVDLSSAPDDRTIDTIMDGLMEHLVLVFPQQDITAQQLFDLGNQLGDLEPKHPLLDHVAGFENMLRLENGPDRPPNNEDWHADMTFRARPPQCSLLQAKVLPSRGGDTMFANMCAIYDDLSDAMKAMIENLTAIHDVDRGYRKILNDPKDQATLRTMENMDPANSRVSHPVTGTHPVSGRQYLNVSECYTSQIDGMSQDEGDALLKMLTAQVWNPRYQLRHRWAVNDLVIFDNLATQHYAVGDYTEYRRMHRMTVKTYHPATAHKRVA